MFQSRPSEPLAASRPSAFDGAACLLRPAGVTLRKSKDFDVGLSAGCPTSASEYESDATSARKAYIECAGARSRQKIRAIGRNCLNLRGTTNASGWGWCYPVCCG